MSGELWFGVFRGQFGGNLEGFEGKLEAREAEAGEREGTGVANGIGLDEKFEGEMRWDG